MKTLAALLLSCATATAAWAGDTPDITFGEDGTVVARMLVDAPVADVRTVFPDIQATGRFDNVLDVKVTPDGTCRRVFRRTKGLFSPFEMYTRLCPTPQGWREYLVKSDDYDAYDVEFTAQPKDGRTEVQLTVRSSITMPVPSSLVRSGTVSGVNQTFAELMRRLFAKREAR